MTARNNIFVRGRGIDAELGGSLTIRGSAADPVVTGGFEMRRGRIVILTKRLDFTTGKITFGGSLVPILNMVASTSSDQTTINITVTGPANNPDISFGSAPSLPQDEVVARLIFGQSISRLSALQIAQLADAVTQPAGVEQLRQPPAAHQAGERRHFATAVADQFRLLAQQGIQSLEIAAPHRVREPQQQTMMRLTGHGLAERRLAHLLPGAPDQLAARRLAH